MTATETIRMHEAPPGTYSRARWLCDRLGITDRDEFDRLLISVCHEEFMRAIEPWQAIKTRLFLAAMPPPMYAVVRDDGALEMVQPMSAPMDEVDHALKSIDERIAAERRRFFGWLGDEAALLIGAASPHPAASLGSTSATR